MQGVRSVCMCRARTSESDAKRCCFWFSITAIRLEYSRILEGSTAFVPGSSASSTDAATLAPACQLWILLWRDWLNCWTAFLYNGSASSEKPRWSNSHALVLWACTHWCCRYLSHRFQSSLQICGHGLLDREMMWGPCGTALCTQTSGILKIKNTEMR